MRVIKLPYGNLKKLADRAGMSRICAMDALAMRTGSERADEVRRLALEEFGGYWINMPTKKYGKR